MANRYDRHDLNINSLSGLKKASTIKGAGTVTQTTFLTFGDERSRRAARSLTQPHLKVGSLRIF